MSKNNFNLTELEERILNLVARGADNSAIANKIFISSHTVKAHISVILKKLKAENRTHATYIALKYNIIK